jgi:hypothetical protein
VKVGYNPLSKIPVLTRNLVVDITHLDNKFHPIPPGPWHMFRRRFHVFLNEDKVEDISAVFDLEQVMGGTPESETATFDTSLHEVIPYSCRPHHYPMIPPKIIETLFFHLVQDLNLEVGDIR